MVRTNNSTGKLDENKSHEQLIQELADIRAQLAVEKKRRRELSQKLTRIKSHELWRIAHHYHHFFDAIQQGLGLAEIRYADNGAPCDLRMVKVNQAAARIMQIDPPAAQGKSFTKLFPDTNPSWIDILSQVVRCKGSVQIERSIPPLKKRFSIHLFCPEQDTLFFLLIDITTQNPMKSASQQSDEHVKHAITATQSGVYSCNIQTGEDYCSPELLEIYGLGPSDRLPLKDGIPAASHPEDRQKILDDFRARLNHQRKPDYSCEHRIILPDGKTRWVMIRGKLYFDHENKPLSTIGIVLDITERKWTQEALDHLSQFPEENPNPVLRCRPDGIILYANAPARHWLTTLGWQADDPLPGSLGTAVSDAIDRDCAIEVDITNPSGRTFSILGARPSGEKYINLYGIDITNRKRAEEDLRESKRQVSTLMKSLPGMAYRCRNDPDWTMTFVSDGCRSLTGYDSQALVESTKIAYAQVIHPQDRQMVWEAVQAALKRRQAFQIVYRIITESGELKWVWEQGQGIFDREENFIALEGFITDITEQKRLEAEHLELERRVQQIAKAESLSLMAGAVAHHFNNMLAAVMGNLELAREDLPPKSDITEYLKEADQAARRAADMSRLMLAFLGQSQGLPEALYLSQTCRNHLKQLEADLPTGVSLTIDLPQPGPIIKVDSVQLNQVITNLVTNAWESISILPGRVRVIVGSVKASRIPTENRFPMEWEQSADNYACLSVEDTGRGMTAKIITRIFDPFFTDKFTGRGLGLPVTLGIVKSFGGCITVTSIPGNGSTLRVYWPLSSGPLAQIEAEGVTEQQVPMDTGTVLLVEDQKKVRNVGKAMLERIGFEVKTAGNGAEAVEIFRKHRNRFCLVLTDLTMPRMNGWETLIALRQLKPDIPVILASGYYEAQVMQGEHLEQPQAFLHKPYHMEDLKTVIKKALGEKFPFEKNV